MITNIEILKQDLPYIHDLNNYLVKPEIFHPHNPKYIKQWNTYRKHVIEGIWVYDKYGWRFMPPTLFLYGNFFKFETRQGKQTIITKPDVRDIDWLIHYSYLEAMGFSGFKNDEKYTSDRILFDQEGIDTLKRSRVKEDVKRYEALFKSNGTYKEFAPANQYLKELNQVENLGIPVYFNSAKNMLVFGSRGGGKSYSVAGIVTQAMITDGMKEYSKEVLAMKPKVNINIGAGESRFSSELISKIVKCLELYGTDPDFGAWSSPQKPDFIEGPFYVDWIGSYGPNNSENPYRYEYDVETPSGWHTEGSGTKLFHTNYSDKKKSGAQAGSGSRNNIVVYEEIGLQPNFVDALLNNVGTVMDNKGEQFGVQIGIGTSGNIDLVQQSKKVFSSPKTYNFLEYDNLWEPGDNSKIGLFLPAYLTNSRFKDENGNTDIEASLKYYTQRREEAYKADDPEVYRNERMNYPIVPSDMWQSSKGSYFPIAELQERELELTKNQYYKSIGRKVELVWDSSSPRGVRANLAPEAEPFYTFPFDRSMSKLDGCVVIYEEPQTIKNEIPEDMYIYTLDPYVSENIDEGGSIGCFQVWMNPKYTMQGFNGSTLVATYYGKNPDGKDAFYSVVEKLIQYYGNCPRMLWYEANRGDSVRGYFMRKNKLFLLCLRPSREKGSHAVERKVAEYGFIVGNQIDKLSLITDASEHLLSFTQNKGVQKRVVETIPDLFLIQQLIPYHLKGNFDAVSAYLGFPLAIKELEHQYIREAEKMKKKNPLAFIALNKNIFHVNK